MSGDEWGDVQARRDRFGPFIEVRWRQSRVAVREWAWVDFVAAVWSGVYQPERVEERRGWVCFEIDERLAEAERPVGWRVKSLRVPRSVWDRFVVAVGDEVFARVAHEWVGAPHEEAQKPSLPGDSIGGTARAGV